MSEDFLPILLYMYINVGYYSEPVLRDHCHETTCLERPDIPTRRSHLSMQLKNLSPKTTCLERPHFMANLGVLQDGSCCTTQTQVYAAIGAPSLYPPVLFRMIVKVVVSRSNLVAYRYCDAYNRPRKLLFYLNYLIWLVNWPKLQGQHYLASK